MADWFETRFREPVDAGHLDPAFAARMRALVVEEWQTAAGATSPYFDPDDREGDLTMLETEDRGADHDPVTPRRPSPRHWFLVAAAAAVIAVGGSLLVAAAGDDDERRVDTATSAPPTALPPARDVREVMENAWLEPGRYFVDPDGDDATSLRVTYEVSGAGWEPAPGAARSVPRGDGFTGVFINTVTNVAADGCRDHTPLDPPVGPTVDDLATALSRLAPFELTAAPTDVTFAGYRGKRLQLTVPDLRLDPAAENYHDFADCVDGQLFSWFAPNTQGPMFGYDRPGVTEEFWILDVAGTRLVLTKMDSPLSPPAHVAERDAIFDSIRIEP